MCSSSKKKNFSFQPNLDGQSCPSAVYIHSRLLISSRTPGRRSESHLLNLQWADQPGCAYYPVDQQNRTPYLQQAHYRFTCTSTNKFLWLELSPLNLSCNRAVWCIDSQGLSELLSENHTTALGRIKFPNYLTSRASIEIWIRVDPQSTCCFDVPSFKLMGIQQKFSTLTKFHIAEN